MNIPTTTSLNLHPLSSLALLLERFSIEVQLFVPAAVLPPSFTFSHPVPPADYLPWHSEKKSPFDTTSVSSCTSFLCSTARLSLANSTFSLHLPNLISDRSPPSLCSRCPQHIGLLSAPVPSVLHLASCRILYASTQSFSQGLSCPP